MIWNPLQHPYIVDGYDISPYGDIRYNKSNLTYKATYHSSNGYDYAPFILNDPGSNSKNKIRLFPIDEIIAMVYIPVPHELCGKRLTVKHINGDNRDISLSNLEWIEDIEIWKTCTYPGVKPNTYEVSNHGNVRNIITGKILNGWHDHHGYHIIGLQGHNEVIQCGVHRFVSYEFVSIETYQTDIYEVNHIDSVQFHNHYKNLEVVTHVENMNHSNMFGLAEPFKSCDEHFKAKFTNETIHDLCKTIVECNGDIDEIMSSDVVKKYNIERHFVGAVKNKYVWTSISDQYFDKYEFRTLLTEHDVKIIVKYIDKYRDDPKMVHKVFNDLKYQIKNITKTKIIDISSGRSWSYLTHIKRS
jgi:hypothetical protein